MNLPNKLTILRIVLVPLFVALLLIPAIPYNEIWAILVFSLASLTDMLDGKIARKHGLVTDFGKFADPVADKIVTMSAFVCFVALGRRRAGNHYSRQRVYRDLHPPGGGRRGQGDRRKPVGQG